MLRVRAIAEIHRLQITELTSERKRLAIELREEPHRVAEPARWLADVLVLGADLALARGAHPSHGPPPPGLAAQLAAKLAARIPGATMARSDDNLAVVWSDARIGLGNDVVTIELRGAASEELDELFALHELRSMTHDGDQLAFEVCDLDEVTDDGAAAYRIASDLIRVVRPR